MAELKKPDLRKSRPAKPITSKKEDQFSTLGNLAPDAKKTRDFNVPMNEYEHSLFEQVEKLLKDELAQYGAKTSRRSLARQWLTERIKEEAEKRGLVE